MATRDYEPIWLKEKDAMVDTSPYVSDLSDPQDAKLRRVRPHHTLLQYWRREGMKHQNLCTSQVRVEAHSMPHEWHTRTGEKRPNIH